LSNRLIFEVLEPMVIASIVQEEQIQENDDEILGKFEVEL